MRAVLIIELEVLTPILLTSATELRTLYPSDLKWVSIRLTAETDSSPLAVTFVSPGDDPKLNLKELVDLAQLTQPEGTTVRVWFQGRSESFVI